jgi:thiol-disulfide isomerase/thioredoxin
MRKSLMVGLVAAVLIIAAVIAIVVNTLPKDMPTQNGTPAKTEQQPQQQPSTESTAGVYTPYTAAKVNEATGTKILFFHASWCPQCRALDKSINEGTIPGGVTIFKVDYDTNQVLRQQYGVTIQTTLVKIDNNGKLIAKYVAYEQPTLQALIDNLL